MKAKFRFFSLIIAILAIIGLAFASCNGTMGPEGQPGTGTVISICNETGNWVIDGVNTGIPVQGPGGTPGTPGSVITICPNTGNWLINGIDTGIPSTGAPGSVVTIERDAQSGYYYWFIDGVNTGRRAPAPQPPQIQPPAGVETIINLNDYIGLYNLCGSSAGSPIFTLISNQAGGFLALRIGARANPWGGLGISFTNLIDEGILSASGTYTLNAEGLAGIPAAGHAILRTGASAWDWEFMPLTAGRPFSFERDFVMDGANTSNTRITTGPLGADTVMYITGITITNAAGNEVWTLARGLQGIMWAITATPAAGMATAINFEFSEPVTGLTLNDITVTGPVTTGALTGSGTSWSLEISVITPGRPVAVLIERRGITRQTRLAALGGPQMAAGVLHSAAIRADGSLWAWGRNNQSQLGDGTTVDRVNPVRIQGAHQWVQVSAGAWHTVAIRADGSLWEWGSNSDGRLPTRVGINYNWVQAVAGGGHTIALRSDGSLWVWGSNHRGQLGDGTTVDRHTLVNVGVDMQWIHVTAGDQHSAAITTDGTLWAWRNNIHGQMGNGTATTFSRPVVVQPGTRWKHVCAGAGYHNLGIKPDGSLWAWGNGITGAIGDGEQSSRWSPVRVGTDYDWVNAGGGAFHSMAIKADGSLWTWGRNSRGQLGDGTITYRLTPVRIGDNLQWKQIDGDLEHTGAVATDGSLWVWGNNVYGRLGDGSVFNRSAPAVVLSGHEWEQVSAGGFFTAAIRADGSLWTWGWNHRGQLGDGTTTSRPSPVQIQPGQQWKQVSASPAGGSANNEAHVVAIRNDGSLWAWGSNLRGQIGDGYEGLDHNRTIPVNINIQPGTQWKQAVAGRHHTIAIRADDSLWTWGLNDSGQLGIGSFVSSPIPVQVLLDTSWKQVAAGQVHSMGIRTDGSLWAWGVNSFGRLGDGTNVTRTIPVNIQPGTQWKQAVAGRHHTIAIRDDDSLWIWGLNGHGQLGIGSFVSSPIPVQVLPGTSWKQVAAGEVHSMGIRTDGSLWAWGVNSFGRLGDGTNVTRNSPVPIQPGTQWKQVAAGEEHTVAIRADGTLWVWGRNTFGQLGVSGLLAGYTLIPVQIQPGTLWQYVSAGRQHTMGLRIDGSLWAWGSNGYSQLGDGTSTGRNTPVRIGTGNDWVQVSAGSLFTMGITGSAGNRVLHAWGSNNSGQHGCGAMVQRNNPYQVVFP